MTPNPVTVSADELRELIETGLDKVLRGNMQVAVQIRDCLRELATLRDRSECAGGVTDEAVDVIGKALYIYWDDVNKVARNAYRKKIRAALETAFLIAEPVTHQMLKGICVRCGQQWPCDHIAQDAYIKFASLHPRLRAGYLHDWDEDIPAMRAALKAVAPMFAQGEDAQAVASMDFLDEGKVTNLSNGGRAVEILGKLPSANPAELRQAADSLCRNKRWATAVVLRQCADRIEVLEQRLPDPIDEAHDWHRCSVLSCQECRALIDTGFDPSAPSATDQFAPRKMCNGCGRPLYMENLLVDDGCGCNTPRGVNFTPKTCALCGNEHCTKPAHHIEAVVKQLTGVDMSSAPSAIPAGHLTDDHIADIAYKAGWDVRYEDYEGDETDEPHVWGDEGDDCFGSLRKFAHKLTMVECSPPLAVLTELVMVSDPWPLQWGRDILTDWLDSAARAQGYEDWLDAYHKVPR